MDTLKKVLESVFVSTDEDKEALTKLWNETKNQAKAINGVESTEYIKGFIKIRYESDHDLPLSKTLNISSMIIVATSAF